MIRIKSHRFVLRSFPLLLTCIFFSVAFLLPAQASSEAATPHEQHQVLSTEEGKQIGSHSDAHSDSHSGDHSGGHEDPFTSILFLFAIVILAAGMGRTIAKHFDQPGVLGELGIGVILGNILYWMDLEISMVVMHMEAAKQIFEAVFVKGLEVSTAATQIFTAEEMKPGGVGAKVLEAVSGEGGALNMLLGTALWIFSNLGVILLLFMVGLETTVDEMKKVGGRALAVAVIGIAAPFGLGLMSGHFLLPDESFPVHLFLAATLCATSVGITARVFLDLGKLRSKEAQIILGAAVFDDILGLLILAIVVGIVATGSLDWMQVAQISGLSALFLGTLILFGDKVLEKQMPLAVFFTGEKVKLLFPLSFAFFLSWAAGQIGLASIVGAFAAGLIMSERYFEDKKQTVHELLVPLESVFVPVFFVLMGMQVNLESFADADVILLAVAFTVAAIVGKLVSGIPAGKDLDRLSVGIGMIPRGEVGLIFASIGKGLGVVTDGVFSAIVIMVIVTTLITPLALKWSLFRDESQQGSDAPA